MIRRRCFLTFIGRHRQHKKDNCEIQEDVRRKVLKGTEEFQKHREPSQILHHQSTDSAKEHHDAPLWISRTKELRTLQ